MTGVDPPICVALDVPDLPAAQAVVEELEGLVPMFKVGLELFCAEGPETVRAVRASGAQVLLDLKVHDIPRTAAATVRVAGRLGASLLTVHGLGGREMIRAAVEAAREGGGPGVLVVTVLTSLGDEQLAEVGLARSAREQALLVGELAAEEGAEGLVCSPHELEVLRPAFPQLLLATPGIRPAGTDPADHRRSLEPGRAIVEGADLIVVGRPVLEAADRRAAAARIVEEVRVAEAQREGPHGFEPEATIAEAEDVEMAEGP